MSNWTSDQTIGNGPDVNSESLGYKPTLMFFKLLYSLTKFSTITVILTILYIKNKYEHTL